jgi:DNA mismatch repair protein MSH6
MKKGIKSTACKLGEFLSCLRGFEMAWEGVKIHLTPEVREQFKSPLLRNVCTLPDLEPCLEAMHSYFDWDDARDSGAVTPQQGLDPNLDEAIATVKNLLDKLAAHLKEVKTRMPVIYIILKCEWRREDSNANN